ncbi:MAG: hypothetical protein IT547_08245 [Hyphomonadaceae bacterium]|jgi:hypothetical protein|nr:hypothetical protein [Hyphomonadaceae bacterium]
MSPFPPLHAALAVALLGAMAGPAAAGGGAHCGGFVRQIGTSEVELAVRGRRIEVRAHDERGAPLDADASAAFASAGGVERITLSRAAPGLMSGNARDPITARSIMLRLAFADGVVGAARFPVRRATCAAAANP